MQTDAWFWRARALDFMQAESLRVSCRLRCRWIAASWSLAARAIAVAWSMGPLGAMSDTKRAYEPLVSSKEPRWAEYVRGAHGTTNRRLRLRNISS